jgi:hypothetical protein
MTKADLELERYTKNAFQRHNVVQVASTLRDAGFVFFVMLDSDSLKIEVLTAEEKKPLFAIARLQTRNGASCIAPLFWPFRLLAGAWS